MMPSSIVRASENGRPLRPVGRGSIDSINDHWASESNWKRDTKPDSQPNPYLIVRHALGRSLANLIDLAAELDRRGVDLVVLDQSIDTSTPLGQMFFHMLGAIAEFEHALISERTRDGLAAARARGRTCGQKPKLGPRQIKIARQMYAETGPDGKRVHTVQQIADEFGVTRPTIYRHLGRD
jgi:DNA invertase Pin-like site-specific DNA recombinase